MVELHEIQPGITDSRRPATAKMAKAHYMGDLAIQKYEEVALENTLWGLAFLGGCLFYFIIGPFMPAVVLAACVGGGADLAKESTPRRALVVTSVFGIGMILSLWAVAPSYWGIMGTESESSGTSKGSVLTALLYGGLSLPLSLVAVYEILTKSPRSSWVSHVNELNRSAGVNTHLREEHGDHDSGPSPATRGKTTCKRCGRLILLATATRHAGLCALCAKATQG